MEGNYLANKDSLPIIWHPLPGLASVYPFLGTQNSRGLSQSCTSNRQPKVMSLSVTCTLAIVP